jgi:phosphoglycolate phosphatase-like HAD superfamily hydrolase
MIEIIRPNPAPGRLRHAVFDFDGTLSLVRAGWQGVMADMMVEILQATPQVEPEAELRARTDEPIHGLAGRPTLLQMQWLAEEVARRGGAPRPPEIYKGEYLARLQDRVHHLADLKAGRTRPEQVMVPGGLAFVAALATRGVSCYIASGTDVAAGQHEAEVLGLAPYMAETRGARPDGSDAKRVLIGQVNARHQLRPGELAAFGDGRAEIEAARAVGGLAIGVASNEVERRGVDLQKRALLAAAGADAIIPDFSEPADLLAYLWPSE